MSLHPAPSDSDRPSLTAADTVLVGFAEALRHAGLAVTPDRVQTFLRATATLNATRTADVYWAGRATLCSCPHDTAPYDDVFDAWFSADVPRGGRQRAAAAATVLQAAIGDQAGDSRGTPSGDDVVRVAASDVDILRHRDVADLSRAERAELSRMFATLRPRPALRRSARRRPTAGGEIDARRTLRAQLRQVGEPGRMLHRRRDARPRRTVLLIDVSGSMAPYADSLLRLAHTIVRSSPRQVEVFTIGTRLTHLTRAMRERDCDRALALAGEAVPDWSGGTRLGEVLKIFLDRWGQRGMARRAVVVVCSDGWERGDASLLREQMHRLARLAHRVVWMNPHRGKAGYQPVQAGIAAALPYVDDLVAGHSLATFSELLEVVADA
jgi:uncharacterized protein